MARPDAPRPLANKTRQCWEAFETLCELAEPDKDKLQPSRLSYADIRDEFGRFRVWSRNIGALQKGAASLDYRLSQSPKVRDEGLKLLGDLHGVLQEVIGILREDHPEDTTDASGEAADSEDELDSILEFLALEGDDGLRVSLPPSELAALASTIKETITCLFLLSVTMRRAAEMDRYARSDEQLSLDPRYDIEYVRRKFPRPPNKGRWLLDRLGRAITRRRQYFMYRRHHHGRLARDAGLPTGHEGGREGAEQLLPSTVGTGSELSPSEAPTTATPFREDGSVRLVAPSTQGGRNPTVSSNLNDEEMAFLPPPPPAATKGGPFECPYCFEIVHLRNEGSWRRHILQDLRPFVCTFPSCHRRIFSSMTQWFSHEMEVHRRIWECCVDDCGASLASEEAVSAHLLQKHAELASETHLLSLVQLCGREPLTIPANHCPLCDQWEVQLRRERLLMSPSPTMGLAEVTARQFKHHLGQHMIELAVYALPELGNGDEEEVDPSIRSQIDDWESISNGSSEPERDRFPASTSRLTASERKQQLMARQALRKSSAEPRFYTVAKNGTEQLSKALQDAIGGVSIDDITETGETAVHHASRNGNLPVLDTLVACGAHLDIIDITGSGPLHRAADLNACAILIWLLDHGADIELRDVNGATALNRAARKGHVDAMETLLDRGADIEAADLRGFTPLHSAAQRCSCAATKLLLERGADIEKETTQKGFTPLHLIISKEAFEETASILLQYGANVQTRSHKGLTVLHTAVAKGRERAVKFLLRAGAEIDADGPRGIRAIHRAIYQRHRNVLKILLEHGADTNLSDFDGWSPLYGAARLGNVAMASDILQLAGEKVDREARDNAGMTAFHSAAHENHVEVMKLLAAKGVNVASVDNEGRSALHSAAQNGHVQAVEFLLASGEAALSAGDGTQSTPLHLAAEAGHLLIAEKLLQHGANPYINDAAGRNSLVRASTPVREVMRMWLDEGSIEHV